MTSDRSNRMSTFKSLIPDSSTDDSRTVRRTLGAFVVAGLLIAVVYALTGEPLAALAITVVALMGALMGAQTYEFGRTSGRDAAFAEVTAQLQAEFDRQVSDGEAARP